MSLKKFFLKTKFSYKLYLYYNLFVRHKCFISRQQYSQWGEDILINKFFHNLSKGFYIDIGCYHPYMFNNTCLLHKRGWRGINLDINPASIDLFNISRPRDTNICTTIDEKKREFKMFFDGHFSSVNTLDEDFYRDAKSTYFKNVKLLTVQSKTIEEVISLSGHKGSVDFINIDVEGSDFNILKQINLKRLGVKLVAIETHHVDGSGVQKLESIVNYLNRNNFSIYERVGPTSIFKANT